MPPHHLPRSYYSPVGGDVAYSSYLEQDSRVLFNNGCTYSGVAGETIVILAVASLHTITQESSGLPKLGTGSQVYVLHREITLFFIVSNLQAIHSIPDFLHSRRDTEPKFG